MRIASLCVCWSCVLKGELKKKPACKHRLQLWKMALCPLWSQEQADPQPCLCQCFAITLPHKGLQNELWAQRQKYCLSWPIQCAYLRSDELSVPCGSGCPHNHNKSHSLQKLYPIPREAEWESVGTYPSDTLDPWGSANLPLHLDPIAAAAEQVHLSPNPKEQVSFWDRVRDPCRKLEQAGDVTKGKPSVPPSLPAPGHLWEQRKHARTPSAGSTFSYRYRGPTELCFPEATLEEQCNNNAAHGQPLRGYRALCMSSSQQPFQVGQSCSLFWVSCWAGTGLPKTTEYVDISF